ncbi:N-terminal kinase-like protein isoform X2 [Quercus lobata]|uniref:N-terminal kinase-like protein isoform X2 n=1 Tax=Quercus lobata TaxID=97700 RepID=UPI0012466B47|nr:N-terminal kinase-like protein isoform X2 [Quercus lobata]
MVGDPISDDDLLSIVRAFFSALLSDYSLIDEEPAIRTNTTILLGNIASHLNEGTRKRVLINAFTVRALCDTFSPARGARIMALCATSAYYDVTEIATRILPNVVLLTIDPDSGLSILRNVTR